MSAPWDELKTLTDAEVLQRTAQRLDHHQLSVLNAELQRRQMEYLERQAAAAERAAAATVRYTRYTFWVVVFTALVAAIAVADLVLGK